MWYNNKKRNIAMKAGFCRAFFFIFALGVLLFPLSYTSAAFSFSLSANPSNIPWGGKNADVTITTKVQVAKFFGG